MDRSSLRGLTELAQRHLLLEPNKWKTACYILDRDSFLEHLIFQNSSRLHAIRQRRAISVMGISSFKPY